MVEWIVSSSVLILVVVALRYLLRGRIGLRVQYAVWLLVLIRLLLPVALFASPMSVANALDAAAPPVSGVSTVDIAPKPTASVPAEAQPTAQVAAARPAPAAPALVDVEKALVWMWLAGAAVTAVWLVTSNLSFYLCIRRVRRPVNVPDCPLRVYEGAQSPFLLGRAVYVETDTPPERLRHVLAHELAHWRHGDNVWSALRGLCLVLHWYNPLVWWAAALSRRDAELACDESAIARLGEESRSAYGATLIELAARPATPTDLMRCATTMGGGKASLRERIGLLARRPKTVAAAAVVLVLIAALAVGCTFTGAGGKDASPEPTVTPTTAPTASPTPEALLTDAPYPETPQALLDKIADGEADADPLVSFAWSLIRKDIEAHTDTSYQLFGADATCFTDAEITRLELCCSTDDGFVDGGKASVWQLEYRMRAEDMSRVMMAGGMTTDGDGWLTSGGSMGHPFPVVLEKDGSQEVVGVLYGSGDNMMIPLWELLDSLGIPYADPVEPEDLTLDWQREYLRLYDVIAAAGESPVIALGLVDMTSDATPELLVFDPGAGVSGIVAIYTMEEGELRAFNLDRTYGLPAAKNAVSYSFYANPATGPLEEDWLGRAYLRYYSEKVSPNSYRGFYLLNSRNAASPADVWCDWLRFGADEDGYLKCESLLSWDVSGTESLREGYRETGWTVNGEDVTQERYQEACDEFDQWLDSLSFVNFNWGDYIVKETDAGTLRREFLRLMYIRGGAGDYGYSGAR